MLLFFSSLVYSSSDLIQTIRLVTPAGGIWNKQRLVYASDRKAEDAISILSLLSAKKVISSAVEIMLQAACWLTFALKYDSPSPAV
jgi:hypothetical protein